MMLSMTACSVQPAEQTTAWSTVHNYGTMKDADIKVESIELTDKWDKVFPLSDEVNHRKVTLVNLFGIALVANLYKPKEYTGQLPVIAVCGVFGAVKEQSSGTGDGKEGFLSDCF